MFIVVSESRWQELKKIHTGTRPAGKRKAKGELLEFPVLVGNYNDGFVWQLLKNIGRRKRKP